MAGQNVPLMLTQGITVTNDSLVHFMPDTTPRAAKKVYLVFLSLSAVWTLEVWGAAGELIHDLRSKPEFEWHIDVIQLVLSMTFGISEF